MTRWNPRFFFGVLLALSACSDSANVDSGELVSVSLAQTGVQDIGAFRQLVADGAVPAPETLDEVGFFAEHGIDLPAADCGEVACAHPMLGVAPRLGGSNWTMAFIGMNTAAMGDAPERAPRHVVVLFGPDVADADQRALARPVDRSLEEGDRVSALGRVDLAREPIVGQRVLGGAGIPAAGPLFDHVADALALAREGGEEGETVHVLYVGSGAPAGAIDDEASFEALAGELAAEGVRMSAIGLGADYDPRLPTVLAAGTGGNLYFASGLDDAGAAISLELGTAYAPVVRDLTLEVEAAPGYRIGRVFGAPTVHTTASRATLHVPALYRGTHVSGEAPDGARRGGGGGFFVQLVPDVAPGVEPQRAARAFTLTTRYRDAASDAMVERRDTLLTPLGVGNNPPMEEPYFTDAARVKTFMMLNMYMALRAAVLLYQEGDCGGALGIEEMLYPSYAWFVARHPDVEIDEDYALFEALMANIARACTVPVRIPADFVQLSCFGT